MSAKSCGLSPVACVADGGRIRLGTLVAENLTDLKILYGETPWEFVFFLLETFGHKWEESVPFVTCSFILFFRRTGPFADASWKVASLGPIGSLTGKFLPPKFSWKLN